MRWLAERQLEQTVIEERLPQLGGRPHRGAIVETQGTRNFREARVAILQVAQEIGKWLRRLERDRARAEAAKLRQRFASLTPREHEVLALLALGKLNKQIAAELGVVEQTVKFHRARIMERMGARTVAELMHIAARLDLASRREAERQPDAPN